MLVNGYELTETKKNKLKSNKIGYIYTTGNF